MISNTAFFAIDSHWIAFSKQLPLVNYNDSHHSRSIENYLYYLTYIQKSDGCVFIKEYVYNTRGESKVTASLQKWRKSLLVQTERRSQPLGTGLRFRTRTSYLSRAFKDYSDRGMEGGKKQYNSLIQKLYRT